MMTWCDKGMRHWNEPRKWFKGERTPPGRFFLGFRVPFLLPISRTKTSFVSNVFHGSVGDVLDSST